MWTNETESQKHNAAMALKDPFQKYFDMKPSIGGAKMLELWKS